MLSAIPLLLANVPVPPAPTLTYNHTRIITVGWEPPVPTAGVPEPASYQLQLSVEQRGQAPVHATKHAPADARSIAWPAIPADSDACFRVAAMPHVDAHMEPPPAHYGEATCYSSCSCGPNPPGGGGGGSCTSCAFAGAVVGALLAVAGFAAFTPRAGADGAGKHATASLARGLVGGAYSHVLTAEELGVEMEESRPCSSAGMGRALDGGAMGGGGSGVPPALEPPADLHADQFELRWSSCATRSHVLEATLPGLPDSAPDEVETALVERGFFCVAAGAVGRLHKLYFAAQLRGSADWLMLELVLHQETASAQATFRCDSPHRLAPLADDIAALLGRVLATRFNPQRY